MTPADARRPRTGDGALLTLAWYAVVLVVVFTTAFWLGRTLGPQPTGPDQRPGTPHAPAMEH